MHQLTIFARHLASIGVIAGLVLISPVRAQEKLVLGPKQFEQDKSGAGAVLCIWSLYVAIQAEATECALPRQPIDDAYDKAIEAIDEFILANSSLRPTRPMLDAFKKNAGAAEVAGARRADPNYCKGDMLMMFRSENPAKVQDSVAKLLTIPREPVMNPCL